MTFYIFKFSVLISFATMSFSQPLYLSDFQYLSDSELSGGGPYSGGSVSFGASDTLEGILHTNGLLSLSGSSGSCPVFYGYVRAVSGISFGGGCQAGNVFLAGYDAEADSFFLPTADVVDEIKNFADNLFIADSMIDRPDLPDTLIMTMIEFLPGGFMVNQWPYLIPPIAGGGQGFNDFAYYHNHENNEYEQCEIDGFHHFDFAPPVNPGNFIIYNRLYSTSSGIIHVQGGQLVVRGTVDGQFTLITDDRTYYQRADNSGISDYCYNNIWLIDDLTYVDSDSLGQVATDSQNRLGLISGANVIIANTHENGGGNSLSGSDITINAAIVTLEGSFTAHYWQNTTTLYSAPDMDNPSLSKGDGRGQARMGVSTGAADIRGTVNLWGALVQSKRGYMKRNSPGPYQTSPGIGYSKNYHYDPNFLVSPPPGFENLINPLMLVKYGDVDLNGEIESEDAELLLNYLVEIESLNDRQILNSNVSLDYSVSAFDASLIYQYLEGVLDTIPIDTTIALEPATGFIILSDDEIHEGQSISIPIYLSAAENIVSFESTITFDPNYLEFNQLSWTDIMSDFNKRDDCSNGLIKIAASGISEYSGSATLATLEFNANANLPGNQTSVTVSRHRWNEEIELVDIATAFLFNTTDIAEGAEVPSQFVIEQNFPNPFNPTTTIRYGLPENSKVSLIVYDLKGNVVEALESGVKVAGWHIQTWTGDDDVGKPVGTGIYLARLQTETYSKTIKMLYLK